MRRVLNIVLLWPVQTHDLSVPYSVRMEDAWKIYIIFSACAKTHFN